MVMDLMANQLFCFNSQNNRYKDEIYTQKNPNASVKITHVSISSNTNRSLQADKKNTFC